MISGSDPDAAAPARRDTLSPGVIVLLVVFALLRLVEMAPASHPGSRLAPAKAEAGLDSDAMQDLIQTDLQAKSAFALAVGKPNMPGAVVHPTLRLLKEALASAEALLRESKSPSAARRVMLLRAVLAQEAVPPLAQSHGFAPLDAFTSALPSGVSAPDRARYAAEARLWQTLFEGGSLTPRQTAAAAAQIRRLPRIRWWQYPALLALYQGQGDVAESARYAQKAQQEALPSLLPFGAIGLFRLGMILLGVLWLLYFLVRGKSHDSQTDFWPTVPPALPDAARRLGAGDLMAVFVLYLVAREVIALAVSGFGISHVFFLRGLLAPFRPALERMPDTDRTTAGIVLESVVYLLSAVPPALYLWTLARRRGASLAQEIGWQVRPLGINLLYGFGGFAVASALIIPVALIARKLFQHAPDPSNPVIPQLVGVSGFWPMLLLTALASLAAPLVEELLFRGVFYQAARLKLGVWPAIVVTGLVFGFVHPVGIAEMLAIAVLGGVFAWMAETRKSLLPSMTAHCLQNLSTTLLLLSILSG